MVFCVVIKCETFKLEIRPTMIKPRYLTFFQLGLECDETFKVIRRAILKDLTTVSKKIKLKDKD